MTLIHQNIMGIQIYYPVIITNCFNFGAVRTVAAIQLFHCNNNTLLHPSWDSNYKIIHAAGVDISSIYLMILCRNFYLHLTSPYNTAMLNVNQFIQSVTGNM